MILNKLLISSQDTLKYKQITEDGIMELEKGLYSKCILFNDINFQIAKEEDKESIFLKYGEFLNYFDSSVNFQITISNKSICHEKDVMLDMKNDVLDKFRDEYNKIMKEQLKKGRNDITKEKYITYTIKAEDLKEARAIFTRYDENIINNFKKLGCTSFVLNGKERIKILKDFFNPEDKDIPTLDIKQIHKQGIMAKDIIVPDSFKFKLDYFKMGDKYARVLFLKTLPSFLNDKFTADITDFSFNMIFTMNIKSVSPDKALKLVKKQITGMEGNKIEYQKRAIRSGFSQDILPSELQHSLNQANELLDDLLNKNQKMFITNVLILHTSDTLSELNKDTDVIMSTARKYLCTVGKLKYQQEDALNSTLPMGLNKLNIQRTLTTDSTAIFIPFVSQELFRPGGIYYGVSNISKNLIVFDRTTLQNANSFILGTPGSGKSFCAKKEIVSILLNTDDDVIIIDPESEYDPLVRNFYGEIVKMSTNSRHNINPFDLNEEYSDSDSPISLKAEFILSLCESLMGRKNGLTAKEKTLIDRALHKIYARYLLTLDQRDIPTFLDFQRVLGEQVENEAREIALSLEIYAKGSFSILARKTNVDYNNRLVSFNIRDLGKQLKTIGMLIILDNLWNRIIKNRNAGKKTWIYMDESHVLFKNEYSANFIHELYKRSRKWGGIVTCVTQNVSELIASEQAKTMLSNSKFLLLFNQAPSDREELAKLLKISDSQLNYITNSETGQGLIYTGNYIVPFIDRFPVNTRLYRLLTSKPDEVNLFKRRDL